jgi:hypothetical protein
MNILKPIDYKKANRYLHSKLGNINKTGKVSKEDAKGIQRTFDTNKGNIDL